MCIVVGRGVAGGTGGRLATSETFGPGINKCAVH